MVRVFSVWVLVVVAACSDAHECTEIGCSDGASLTLRTPTHHWDTGSYVVRFTTDGDEQQCAFVVPDDLPSSPGSVMTLSCSSGIWGTLSPEVMCTEHQSGDSTSLTCTPIPNEYYVTIQLQGTPESVAVTVELDDTAVLDETHTLDYRTAQPNGPECGPSCRQASLELTLP